MINKTLKGIFSLSHNVKLYIPSTINTNQESDNSKQVKRVLTVFSKYFGGATSYQAIGAWSSNTKGLVTEKITIIQSFATSESISQNLPKVLKLAQTIKKEMSQESVSLEYDNQLFLI